MKKFTRAKWHNLALLDDVSIIASPLFDLPVLIDEHGNNFDL